MGKVNKDFMDEWQNRTSEVLWRYYWNLGDEDLI